MLEFDDSVEKIELSTSRSVAMTGMRALFVADWVRPVFIHFRVEVERLHQVVPFELDRYDGEAYLSLVAFTQARLRPAMGGRVAAWLSGPLAEHEFLNLRTYVRCGEVRGIYFLAEWIPNRLAAYIGPRTYGLPYRLGRLRYSGNVAGGMVCGDVQAREGRMRYRGECKTGGLLRAASVGSLDYFLLERYTAFTSHRGAHRRFDVNHEPWPMKQIQIELRDTSLLWSTLPFLEDACPCLAHASPGVQDVRISWPLRQTSAIFSCTL